MRAIAFYLPQFSPNEYNDKWWGKGFTEWSYVAQAKPLYKDHYQPHIPADLGFYDLRLIETMKEQQKLAREHGIYGFSYYHYWFDGKLILHEPVDNMLKHKELSEPFCLCFANHTWSRTWDGSNKSKEVMMKFDSKTYNPTDHMDYLIKIFSDERYIKVDGKPMFVIWDPLNFNNIPEVILSWRKRIKEKLREDIYLIASDLKGTEENKEYLISVGYDAVYDHQPNSALNIEELKIKQCNIPTLKTYSYSKVADYFSNKIYNQKVFPGILTSFDSTPRHVENAVIIENSDEKLYKSWLESICTYIEGFKEDEQIVFINAWNEWGEGSHLEPDIRNGRKFLEATRQVIEKYNEIIACDDKYIKIQEKEYDFDKKFGKLNFTIDRNRKIYIWGTSTNSNKLAYILLNNDINFHGYVDNNKEMWGETLSGKEVISPDFLRKLDEKPYIFVASSFWDDISLQLNEYGYEEILDFNDLASFNDKYIYCVKENKYMFLYKYFIDKLKNSKEYEDYREL